MTAHVIRVLTILAKRVWEGGSDAALGQRASVLLLKHILLLSQFLEPSVLESLGSCDPIIRVVD